MQFQVPQFIETEDKIVGPLSLKQFFFVGGGAGFSLILFFLVATWLWFILSVVVVGSAIGLSFVKINGRPLTQIVLAAMRFYWEPQKYVWQPEHPELPKTESNIKKILGGSLSLEKILSGMALKRARQTVEVGAHTTLEATTRALGKAREQYQIFRGTSGDRRIAKRVDYR